MENSGNSGYFYLDEITDSDIESYFESGIFSYKV